MSDIVRLREEMLAMALGARRERMPDWFIEQGYARMKRATAAKVAPKRVDRTPREIMQDDERMLEQILIFHPAKSNEEIAQHVGANGGRASEVMKAARDEGRTMVQGLKFLIEVVRPAYERGDRRYYRAWQRAKRT